MGFLDKLFGRKKPVGDEHGLMVYVQCDKCGSAVRLRIDKRHDLNRNGSGFRWHKKIIDSKCFRPIPTVATFDSQYKMTDADIEGGHYISAEQYATLMAPPAADVSTATDSEPVTE